MTIIVMAMAIAGKVKWKMAFAANLGARETVVILYVPGDC
jgi:hypothetical protein